MDEPVALSIEDSSGQILPAQYNDLIRRRSSGFEGEYRLLWSVLEQAIRTYLRNLECTTPKQCSEFEEVRRWFRPAREEARPQGLFAFETICELLEIDSERLFKELESIRTRALAKRGSRGSEIGSLAA